MTAVASIEHGATVANHLLFRARSRPSGAMLRFFNEDGSGSAQIEYGFRTYDGFLLVGQHADQTYSLFKYDGRKLSWLMYSLGRSDLDFFANKPRLSPNEIARVVQNKVFQV